MLITANKADLIAELTQLRDLINGLTEDATCAVDRAHNELYSSTRSVAAYLKEAGATEDDNIDDCPSPPLNLASYILGDLKPMLSIGADLDATGNHIYARLDDMIRVLELAHT